MDIAILREKYSALTRLIAYCEETADWVETRVELAVQEQPDGFALIDQFTDILKDTRAPGPTRELVLDDLRKVVDESPDLGLLGLFNLTKLDWLNEAFRGHRSLIRRFPEETHDAVLRDVPEYARALVQLLRTDAEVAKQLRGRITQEIDNSATVRGSELTGAERRLVKTLGNQHLTGEELAEAAGKAYSGTLKTKLEDLVKRRILANDHTGYHVLATSLLD